MIKSLKRKMLFTIMTFATIIIAGLVICITVIPEKHSYNEAMAYLNQFSLPMDNNQKPAPNNGLPKPGINPSENEPPQDSSNKNMFSQANIIKINLDHSGNIISWNASRSDLYEATDIEEIYKTIKNKDVKNGYCNGYYFLTHPSAEGSLIAVLDNRVSYNNYKTSLIITTISAFFAWILLFVLSIFIVNKMTRPIANALEQQRQFISDASHELKTPTAVISANADVLARENGESKWLSYIKTETQRMNSLIKNLMLLAEIDNSANIPEHTTFNLSHTVLGAVLPFESLVFENGRTLEYAIDDDLFIKGSKERIEQLIAILISNALRYSNKNGLIRVCVKKKPHKTIELSVYNTGVGIKPEDKLKIFERFYRVEKERSRKSGNYGLGLAIAQTIAAEHNTKITVVSEYNKDITFSILFAAT